MRKSGILMHISSLPSEFGIGKLGDSAYMFANFLRDCGVQVWQILPLSPTSYGDSPYQSFSVHAGNPYFIDFQRLEKKGYLAPPDYADINWGDDPRRSTTPECITTVSTYSGPHTAVSGRTIRAI